MSLPDSATIEEAIISSDVLFVEIVLFWRFL